MFYLPIVEKYSFELGNARVLFRAAQNLALHICQGQCV
jgi:hypothetical protein